MRDTGELGGWVIDSYWFPDGELPGGLVDDSLSAEELGIGGAISSAAGDGASWWPPARSVSPGTVHIQHLPVTP